MTKKRSYLKLGCMLFVILGFVLTLGGGLGLMWATSYDTLVSRPDDPPQKLVVHDTTVVDVVAGTLREHVDVHITGKRIESIAPTAEPEKGAAVIDGKGKYVVPGLIDLHVHLAAASAAPWVTELPIVERSLEQLLFAGVTRVFDPGSASPDIFETRAEIAAGELLGPTLHAAGPIFTAVGGHPVPMVADSFSEPLQSTLIEAMTREIGSAEDANRAVKELARHKPDFIKLVVDMIPDDTPRFSDGLPKAIVDAASANDLRAVAHIGSTEDAIVAGDAGVTAWIHGVYREDIPEERIDELASYGIPMIPTIIVFKSYAELGRERAATPLERQMAEPETLTSYENVPDDYESSPAFAAWIGLIRDKRDAGLRNAKRLHEAGVTILAGSDQQAGMVPGASLHRELDLLQKAGLPPLEVLRAATLYAARFLANDEDPAYGIVAPKKQADLLIVKANPLEDVAALSEIDSVVLNGVLLERHPLGDPRP